MNAADRPGRRSPTRLRHPGIRVPVLIVNDNAAQRLALGAVLAPLGYEIVEARLRARGVALRDGRRTSR